MQNIPTDKITDIDPLGRPLLPYRVAKQHGIRKGDTFQTECGTLRAAEYIDWNPRTNRRFAGFACLEVKA